MKEMTLYDISNKMNVEWENVFDFHLIISCIKMLLF